MLIRWWYHVRTEKGLLYPNLLAQYIALATAQNTGVISVEYEI